MVKGKNMNRYTEDMKMWLFDVAHNNLQDEEILKGFIKYYVLFGESFQKITDDIVFHTIYGSSGAVIARDNVLRVLNNLVAGCENDNQ